MPTFERVTNISDYLDAIKGRDEFVVAVKGDYTVINYAVMMADTFPDPATATSDQERRNFILRRDCRGIIFETATGDILRRPYQKFFNAGEREETQFHKIDFSKPHVILSKLDGSMIAPFVSEGKIRWGTKMGVTDVALPVEQFVSDKEDYINFAVDGISTGVTLIFEWCSRIQKIVLDYPEDQLILTAIRDNITGEYHTYDRLHRIGSAYNIPVVTTYEGTAENMESLAKEVEGLIGLEGFVVRFDDGAMVKVKCEDYLRKHKAKEAIQREKNIVELFVTEKADDVKSFMDPNDLVRFEKFETEFWLGVRDTALDLNSRFAAARTLGLTTDRKRFAVEFVLTQPEELRRFLFKMFDNHVNTFELIKEAIAANCSTQTRLETVRPYFRCSWNEVTVNE